MPLSDYFPEMEGWESAKTAEATVAAPAPPDSTLVGAIVSPYLRTALPLPLQYPQDTLRQYNRPGLSSYRTAPLAPNAPAASSAAAASVATTIAKQVVATSVPAPTLGLNIPRIFTPTTQTVTLPGPLSFNLAVEPINTFLGAPLAGLTALNGINTNGFSIPSGASTHPTITFTPVTPGWAFYMEVSQGNTSTAPNGWTVWGDGGALTVPSTAPITATDTASNALAWANTAITFSGTIPTFVGNHQTPVSFPTTSSGSASITFTPVAGNYLIVSVYGSVAVGAGNNLAGVTVGDNFNDTFNQIVTVGAAATNFGGASSLVVFIVPAVAGGSTTITANLSGKFTAGVGFTLSVTEVTPFQAGSAAPIFRLIAATDLPGIPTSKISGAPLPLVFGGTGSNLNTTGGLHKFLAQATAGANVTVIQPDWSDLAGATGNLATSYNGIALVSNGIPTINGQVNNTTALANIALSTLLVVGASGAGLYRVSGYVIVNRVATTSSTLPDLNLQWTDQDNATVQNLTFVATTPSANTLTTVFQFTVVISVKASTNIQYQTGDSTPYASSGATQMQYSVRLRAEAL